MTTTTTFDLERFTTATEARDAATQLAMYAPDATVTIIDEVNRPGHPRVLGGQDRIGDWLEDVCGRDMSHSVTRKVADDAGAAYVLTCRYPNGDQVACATVLTLDGGLIEDQTIVQAWDESD